MRQHVQPTSPTNFFKQPSQLIPQPTSSINISDQTSHLGVTPTKPRSSSPFALSPEKLETMNPKEHKENQTTYTLSKKIEKEAEESRTARD